MKKTTKNLLITFGSVVSITAPIVSVISCGDSAPKDDPYKTNTGEMSLVDNKVHYTMQYIRDHHEKFFGSASVLKDVFASVVLPEDFKLPDNISILEQNSFASAVFPENFKETFSSIRSFGGTCFDYALLPKSYSPSSDSHGGGGLNGAVLYEGFKVPLFTDSVNNNYGFPVLPAGLVWFDEKGNQIPDNGHDKKDPRHDTNGQVIIIKANWTVGKPKI